MSTLKTLRAITVSTLTLFSTVLFAAQENTYLVYFDVSKSAVKDHKSYIADYIEYTKRYRAGDKVMSILLAGETYKFNPQPSVTIPQTDARLSAGKQKQIAEAALYLTYAGLPKLLAKDTLSRETSILGALISAADYFNQENIPNTNRVVTIFTDGIEESSQSGIFMPKKLPLNIKESQLKLPSNLNASVFMFGIDPSPLKLGSYTAHKAFWESAVTSTGSTLNAFRHRLGDSAGAVAK